MAKCAKGIQTPIFAKGQKLTHSPAHVEKHAGQETPLLYTPYLVGERYCNWLKPPLRITTPTLTLYWVLLKNKVVAPNDPPVKKTREHSAAKQLWPNRDVTTHFPARTWRGEAHRWRAQRGCRWSRTALASPG